jgi:hypothetical protein
MIRRDRDPLEDERAAARLTTEPVQSPIDEGHLASALGAAVVLLAVLILKPWTGGTPEPSRFLSVTSTAPATATPVPTEDRTADGLAVPICLGTGAWRVASLETWQTQDVRVWRAIDPIADATGPLDPQIPSVPIVAIQLAALGWCAPAYGPGKPVGPAIVTAWTLDAGAALPLQLRQVRPADGVTPIAAMYVPLTRCPNAPTCAPQPSAPVPTPWTTAHIVFHYQDTATTTQAWFAADITILPPPPGPSPIETSH